MRLSATAAIAAAIVAAFVLGRRDSAVPAATPAGGAPVGATATAIATTGPAAAHEFLGVILARVSADLAPRFPGRLKDVAVRLGDRVATGGVIAVLEVPALRSDLRAAEAALNTAAIEQTLSAVELSEADERLARSKALSASALASGEELATARYQRQRSAARLEAARAQRTERATQVDRLRKDNDDAVMRAPFAGTIAARYADPGANVSAATPIVRIISTSDFIVRFAVPQRDVAAAVVGRRVRVRVGAATILRGAIEKVAPEIDPVSLVVFAEAGVTVDDAGAPRSGEVVHVSLEATP